MRSPWAKRPHSIGRVQIRCQRVEAGDQLWQVALGEGYTTLDLRPLYAAHCAGKFTFACDDIPTLEGLRWVDEANGSPLEPEEMTPRSSAA